MITAQRPIHSGFGAATTADEIIKGVDLSGKTAIVTGGYSGIGRESARVLRNAGARVIVPARDISRAAAALDGIGAEIEAMDLLDPKSIDAFAARFLSAGQPLHLLINNAGIMANPLTRDARGYEWQFATNHLGHFQLTKRLWPALLQAKCARVVCLSSRGHHYSPVVFDDPNFERRDYDRWAAYGQSKTANILFAISLDERGQAHGVRAFAVHPGAIIGTGLEKHLSLKELQAAGAVDEKGDPVRDPSRNLKTVEQGAATTIWCTVSPQLNDMGGVYCENADIADVAGDPANDMQTGALMRRHGVMPYAIDRDAAARLWALSERLLDL